MKTPYLSIKQRFLLLVTAALLFGLTPAIHAEGLSGLKDSLNKGKIDSTTIEQTKQESDISDIPQNSTSAVKPAAKLQIPVKKVQIKKPARIKEVQVKKSGSRLKRIGAPIKTPDKDSYSFSISNFPAIDESKYNLEAIKALKAMREKATGYGNVEYDLKDFCAKYSAYTELCNLGRLYVIQQKLKIGKTYDLAAQKYLEELTGEFVYGSNEVTAFIDDEVKNKMIPVLNDYDNKVIEKQHAYALKEVDRLQKELADMIKNYVFKPSDLENLKSQITASYQKMIEAYIGMKITNDYNLAEAKKFINEITAFYNNLSLKYTIKFQESPDKPPIDKEISVTKDGRTFINYLYSYIEAKIQYCQYSTDNKEFYSILNGKTETTNDMGNFDDFIARISNQPAGEIAFTQAEKDAYIKNIENYRKNVGKIKQIYFQKEISSGNLYADYIAKTNECILLRAEVIVNDPENHDIKILTPPVKIEFFSNISKISSEVTLKKSAIAKGYCTAMGNNNTNLWPINDKPDAQKESIACFNGEKINEQLLEFYKTSSYFSNNNKRHIFGYSSRKIPFNEDNVIIKNSDNFLKSGGCEFVIAETDGKKATVLIEHQADWFIVDSHGWILETSSGQGGIIEDSNEGQLVDYVHVNPKEIYNNGESLYSKNIDVLVLSACGCLKWVGDDTDAIVFAMGWHRILPKGIILGYNEEASYTLASDVLNDFISKFPATGTLSTDEITTMWIDSNIKKFEEYLNQDHPEYGQAAQKHYKKSVYIVEKEYYYINNCQTKKRVLTDKIVYDISVNKSNMKHYTFKK